MKRTQTSTRHRRLGRFKLVIFALVATTPLILGGSASAAPDEAQCNGVFDGATPHDPIEKVADSEQVQIGQDVTFTIGWHSTGVDSADVTDCYRVDDGTDEDVNALVTGFNATKEVANVGEAGSAQSTTFTITVPFDPALIGHSIVDRAKITHGSVESRSPLVSVSVVAPPEVCANEIDDDFDGQTDEGCEQEEEEEEEEDNDRDTTVLPRGPRRAPTTGTLPATGSTNASVAVVGTLLLLAGVALRTFHPSPLHVVFGGRGTALSMTSVVWTHVVSVATTRGSRSVGSRTRLRRRSRSCRR